MDKAKLNAGVSAPAIITRRGFAEELGFEDRNTLRNIVRKTHRNVMPGGLTPSDYECDKLIDSLGPVVQANMLRQAILTGKI